MAGMTPPSLSCRLHSRIWPDCERHSVCAHMWQRRHRMIWRSAIVLTNIGGVVWHLVRERRLVLDHVQRSHKRYHG